MGAFNEGPLADPEYHEPVPRLIPTQERHVVHPPADHDKLVWCREVIDRLDVMINAEVNLREMHRFKFQAVKIDLESRLGSFLHARCNWDKMRSNDRWKNSRPPPAGTWEEARALDSELVRLGNCLFDASAAKFAMRLKRRRYKSILNELESNIEYWEGV